MVGGQRKETGKGDEDGMQRGGEGKDKTKPPVSDRTRPTLPSQRQRGQSPPTFPNSTKHIQYRWKKEGLFLSRLPETDTASPFFPYRRRNRLHVPEKASSRPGRDGRRPRWISLRSPRLFPHPPLSASSSLPSSLETGGVAVANARFSPHSYQRLAWLA